MKVAHKLLDYIPNRCNMKFASQIFVEVDYDTNGIERFRWSCPSSKISYWSSWISSRVDPINNRCYLWYIGCTTYNAIPTFSSTSPPSTNDRPRNWLSHRGQRLPQSSIWKNAFYKRIQSWTLQNGSRSVAHHSENHGFCNTHRLWPSSWHEHDWFSASENWSTHNFKNPEMFDPKRYLGGCNNFKKPQCGCVFERTPSLP